MSFSEFNRVFSLSNIIPNPLNGSLVSSANVPSKVNMVKSTANKFYRDSPQKSNTSTYLSPLRDTSVLNQSMSKSVNRSIELNNSSLKDSCNMSYTRSKFSTYEEEVFVEYLRETLINERETERLKCQLAMRTDFNFRELFKVFQFNNYNYINSSDIKIGFNIFNVYPSNEEVDLLIKRYDGTNILSNLAFNSMLLPLEIQYNNLMKSRVGNDFHIKYAPEIFSFETRYILENLFKALVNTEVNAEIWRQKFYCLKTFDARQIFAKIDYLGKNYLNSDDVKI